MKSVKISFLGGVGEIGKNMTALEFGDEIIIVDCGMAFPTGEMPGVDLVIPDIAYLIANRDRVKAFFLTHGHEDHIGGLPYILKEIDAPVYGTKLTLVLLENKFKEHKVENPRLITVTHGETVRLKNFQVEFIKVCHSIAGSCALAITSPAGVIMFSGDFKLDFEPVDGVMTDLTRIAELGKRGVKLLLMDSTNIERPGYTMSESTVGRSFNNIFADNVGRRIFIATFSSNIHRIQQIIDLAEKYGRKVAFGGRSMHNIVDSAVKIGELRVDKNNIIDIEKNAKYEDGKLAIITTGSQGEPMSALVRIAADEFNKVKITENDTVVISASPIPGNEKMVYSVINNLYKKGAKVIYESLAEVHVSGHACQEELKIMFSLIKPEYFIPVHGEARHLKKHADLAQKMGAPKSNILIPEIGSQIELNKNGLKALDNIPAGMVMVDGLGVGDVGAMVLRDRKTLSEDGLVVAAVLINAAGMVEKIDIESRGFIYLKEADSFIGDTGEVVKECLEGVDLKGISDLQPLKNCIRKELRNYFYRMIKRTPMVLPIIIVRD